MIGYTETSLVELLGEPQHRGNLIGDGSAGAAETPWAPIKSVPLGPDRYMVWFCDGVVPHGRDGPKCTAINPRRSERASAGTQGDLWYVVETCPAHSHQFEVTEFLELFPADNGSDATPVSPKLLILDAESYGARSGDDWDEVAAHLADRWTVILVHHDVRFPKHVFAVLEKR